MTAAERDAAKAAENAFGGEIPNESSAAMNLVKRLLAKYLLLWLVATCVVAYFWPTLFGKDAANPFLLTANGMSTLIFVTMTAVGSLLPFEEVKAVAKRWPKTLGGTAVQYLSMPTLAFCAAKLFGLEGGAFVGAILAGCVPGAMASNVLTLTARGNVSYSVGLTTLATALSPIVVPLTIEVGMQNAGLGTALAARYFADLPEASLFCASYTFGCMATGIILAQAFRIWTERQERRSGDGGAAKTNETPSETA